MRAFAATIVGLFIDDGWLALALLGWCAVVGLAVVLVPPPLVWAGPALFAGCACLLLLNVLRAARA